MSSGYTACCAYIIAWKDCKKILPQHCKKFEQVIGGGLDGLMAFPEGICREYDDFWEPPAGMTLEGYVEACDQAYQDLQDEFKAHTGLDVEFGNYDPERGSTYDSYAVRDEPFMIVLNAVQPTPEAERYKDYISFEMWTEFG